LIQCPAELLHLLTLVILLQIPIIGDSLLIALIFLPRLVLTRHFWTPEQRCRFWTINLNRRQRWHYAPIIDDLTRLQKIDIHPMSYRKLANVQLSSISSFGFIHQFHLYRSNAIFGLIGGATAINRRCRLLAQLDRLISARGIDQLDAQELHKQLYLRQLAFANQSIDEMRQSLQQWCHFSAELSLTNARHLSLMAHAPILLQDYRTVSS